MTDFTNYFGSIGKDVIDARKPPLKTATYSVYRSGAGEDLLIITNGKVAVAGAGNDTIIGVGGGVKGLRYDESPAGVDVDATKGIAKDGYGTIDTFRGINSFFGSTYSDIFRGGVANEVFGTPYYPPSGNDTYIGGGGFDVVYYFSRSDDFVIKPDVTNDTVIVTYSKTGGFDTLVGISEIRFKDKTVSVGNQKAARESIFGSTDNDILYAGQNSYYLKTGGDTYVGSGGFDVLVYPGKSTNYQIQKDPFSDNVSVSWIKEGGTDVLQDIAQLRFDDRTVILAQPKAASEFIRGSTTNEVLYSTSSRYGIPGRGDTIQGGGGYDIVLYRAQFSDFKLQTNDETGLTIIEWPHGAADTLQGISGIQFNDKFVSLSASAPTSDLTPVTSDISWQQISALRATLQAGLDGRPIGINLQKIWYENFQVPSLLLNTRTFTIPAEATPNSVVGYGTAVVRADGSVLVLGGGWDSVNGKEGRLFTAVFRNNLLEASNIQRIDGATHFFELNTSSGGQFIVGLGRDEGSLIHSYLPSGAVGNVIGGTSAAPSVFLDTKTLAVREDSSLEMAAHNTQVIDYNGDGLMDLLTTGGLTPGGFGPTIFKNKGDGTLEAIPLLPGQPGAIGSYSIGWLGKQSDGTYGFALGGPSTSSNPAFVPESNCVVYLNDTFTQLIRVQQLPTPIFEGAAYKGIPLVYPGWLGGEGASHDMNIRTADINGDGRIDVLMGSKIAAMNNSNGFDCSFGIIQFLIAQPDGSFKDETEQRLFNFATTFEGPHHFEFRDINGDGFLDILTEDYTLAPLKGGAGLGPIRHAFYALVNDGAGHYVAVIHSQLGNIQDENVVRGQFGIDINGRPFWVAWNAIPGVSDEATLRLLYLSDSLYTGPNLSNPALRDAPGFNEFYYLLNNPDVQALRDSGAIPDGLSHYLSVGRAQGRAAFAPNAWVQGSDSADFIVLREGGEKAFGGVANDSIQGLAGNDTIDGGAGTDTSIYTGKAAGYSLKFNPAAGTLTLTDKTANRDGEDTLTSIERLQFTDKTVYLDTKDHSSFADLPATMYQFFILAFGAAPGVEYLQQCADAYRGGASVKLITNVFTGKSEFTDIYPTSLSNRDMATKLVTNVVGTSATQTARDEAIRDITGALDNGLSRGDMIFTVFSNLAALKGDAKWGGTAQLFFNQIAVAKFYTETMNQSTTDRVTLAAAISAVTATSDVSTDAAVVTLIGQGLLGG